MSDQAGMGLSRPLLVNGERSGRSVEAGATGGGDKFHPRTPDQARQLLLPQIQTAVEAVASLPAALRAERVYIEAELLPNYLAATYFPDTLLAQVDAIPVGSRPATGQLRTKTKVTQSPTRRLVLAISQEGLGTLRDIAEARGGLGRSQRRAFEEIRTLEAVTVSEPLVREGQGADGFQPWEAVLHPQTTSNGEQLPSSDATLDKWFALVRELGGTPLPNLVRTVGGLTFSPVRAPVAALDQLRAFNPLRAIRPMPQFRPFPSAGPRSSTSMVLPPSTTTPTSVDHRVAVFDCGVERAPSSAFFPDDAYELTSENVDLNSVFHGTGVAAAVMYGLLWPGEQATQPPLPVDNYRVHPPEDEWDVNVYCVLDKIVDTVTQGDYAIVNLSYGPDVCVEEDAEPDRWTSELDQLAYEKDVLFVVAAGNNGDIVHIDGADRVQAPSDMVNGLGVGACNSAETSKPLARADYSAVGPGRPGNRIQPTVVQFGGQLPNEPFPILVDDGVVLSNHGTSFAAPLVVHSLSQAAATLGDEADPNSLRAMAVHFAVPSAAFKKNLNEHGHGRAPLSLLDSFDCNPSQAHLLYRDTIERGEVLSYDLPVPTGCSGKVRLRLTGSYLSPVDPADPTEYTRASLGITLRPHQYIFGFSKKGSSKSQRHDYRSGDAAALISQGYRMSNGPVAKSLSRLRVANEAEQREAGKWETVRRLSANFQSHELDAPVLEVSYLARRSGLLDNEPPELPFALVVTVEEDDSTDFYDRVRAEYTIFNPVSVDAQATIST